MIMDYVSLSQHLRTICGLYMSTERKDVKNFSLKQSVPVLITMLQSPDFTKVLIPVHKQLVAVLPSAKVSINEIKNHKAFGLSGKLVTLHKFDDNIDILSSQTRPKKMTWIGTDGRKYIIVAKPNDDLRKDFRLMEFNTVINKFLLKNAETRRRALQIRTYAVIPLSEKGGLIEWVENTQPYRTIIGQLHTETNNPINWINMSKVAPNIHDPLEVKRKKYLEQWLPMFPLVFHHWFLNTFRDPSSWYAARECFARTCAVMSMVGYVLGLGDRHTENILMDSTSGGVVHVDFSCVFNHGLTLPWPERVPFRLTRNMVYALGPTGYEGVFRRCGEAVMHLLRHEIDPLMAVFRPIYFDALVEQGGLNFASRTAQLQHKDFLNSVRSGGTNIPSLYDPTKIQNMSGSNSDLSTMLATTDRVTKAAAEKLSNMEDRLRGKITEQEGFNQFLAMSVEGQVEELIYEATDIDRLCQMYKGWMPFL